MPGHSLGAAASSTCNEIVIQVTIIIFQWKYSTRLNSLIVNVYLSN